MFPVDTTTVGGAVTPCPPLTAAARAQPHVPGCRAARGRHAARAAFNGDGGGKGGGAIQSAEFQLHT